MKILRKKGECRLVAKRCQAVQTIFPIENSIIVIQIGIPFMFRVYIHELKERKVVPVGFVVSTF